jgi:dTDP-4-dehydrorhamnose reductase
LIQPTDSSQFKQKAKRPAYSCLDCSKAIKEFGVKLHTTESALKIMKEQVEREASHLLKQ